MLLDATLPADLDEVPGVARDLEQRGYAGVWTSETNRDPFLPLLVAGRATTRLQVGTAIAVAFARSPMTVAITAHDLQRHTRGRFVLGLGTQVRAHVERRFSMPWSAPVPRMREYVAALRAIWSAWQEGTPLRFRGEHYTHTLMTPVFSPEPHAWGGPPVYLAAVGPAMTRLAGEIADGLFAHSFTTARYLRERTLPALAEGLSASGRSRSDVPVSLPGFVVTGATDVERAAASDAVRAQIAFYGSTPAYRPVLELHGWEGLADELHALSVGRREDRWTAMRDLVDDEVLDAFAVVAGPADVGARVRERFAGLVDRFSMSTVAPSRAEAGDALLAALRSDLDGHAE
ncbi:TIGR03617 family F420-dependent LLM class oxidoreductase [Geodermatophilus sabuli]|uniref:Probable F420-dependent oxidoreductase, MSMEG_2256 family n=1 Tax=Geodermatophilus sabuli TaxID=1564158 RepID=A0A285EBG9_9ACTN|nr:TIGR03617 family F420-dependent LLM class oxidoreductase [Geodermatophilus sabuli]MBB3085191.1 putative F420-dependent oxidoreductase [Geodermatophilus sabuli]SNX95401.1 probable F420-dependent oxidoreductase, MSMEG_2256 family [Geodermatophilus sabuli]